MAIEGSGPVWVQLVTAFRARIASGIWSPSAQIPSVRELALSEGVNPNTVQRALGELDREGLTLTERAHGRFVTDDIALIADVRRELAAEATRTHVSALRALGLTRADARTLLDHHWNTDCEGEMQ